MRKTKIADSKGSSFSPEEFLLKIISLYIIICYVMFMSFVDGLSIVSEKNFISMKIVPVASS